MEINAKFSMREPVRENQAWDLRARLKIIIISIFWRALEWVDLNYGQALFGRTLL